MSEIQKQQETAVEQMRQPCLCDIGCSILFTGVSTHSLRWQRVPATLRVPPSLPDTGKLFGVVMSIL